MKKIIVIITLFFAVVSCTTANEPVEIKSLVVENSISGKWHLQNLSGGIAGVNLNFNPNDFVLEFNEINRTVTVTNSLQNNVTTLNSGTYSYLLQNNLGTNFLIVNGTNIGRLTLNTNLLLDDNADNDSMQFKYVRL